jgi:hypothetical protein
MPIARAVRMMRQAISPRLAMSRDWITGDAPGSRGARQGREQGFDLVGEPAVPHQGRQVLIVLADCFDHRGARARPGDTDDIEAGGALREGSEQAFHDHAFLAVEGPLAPKDGVRPFGVEQEERVSTHCAEQPVVRCDQVTLRIFHAPFSRTRSK